MRSFCLTHLKDNTCTNTRRGTCIRFFQFVFVQFTVSQSTCAKVAFLDTLSTCTQEPKLFPTALELLCSHCSSDLDRMDCLCQSSHAFEGISDDSDVMLRFEIGCPVECAFPTPTTSQNSCVFSMGPTEWD